MILLQVGDEALTIDAHGTSHRVIDGAAEDPDLVVQGELPTFLAWATGQLNDEGPLDAGLTATGGARGLGRLRRMYAIGSRRLPAGPSASATVVMREYFIPNGWKTNGPVGVSPTGRARLSPSVRQPHTRPTGDPHGSGDLLRATDLRVAARGHRHRPKNHIGPKEVQRERRN